MSTPKFRDLPSPNPSTKYVDVPPASSENKSSSSELRSPASDVIVYAEPPHFLMCGICHDVMEMPVGLSCGHSFCQTCIQKALSRKKECPFCRTGVTSVNPNIALRQALDDQPVRCRFGKRDLCFTNEIFEKNTNGCGAVVKKSELFQHEKDCAYRWVMCVIPDPQSPDTLCNVFCRFNEMKVHQGECRNRSVACPNEGCEEKIAFGNLESHKQQCSWETIHCPNEGCNDVFFRKALQAHNAHCTYRIISCPFEKYGCSERGSPKAIEAHTIVSVNQHMIYLMNAIERQAQSPMKIVSCPKKKFRILINNVDKLVKKVFFEVNLDSSWKVKIWPNGEDKRHKGYVSIRLFSREATANYRVEGPYVLRIVNQSDPAKSIEKLTEAATREWGDSIRGWGFPAFAKIEDVLDQTIGFMKDNKIIIEAIVTVACITETVECSCDDGDD